jgi:integrase
LSAATQTGTLSAMKEFFTWLAWQPGYKSKIHVPDVDYFSPSIKDERIAHVVKLKDFPTLEQIRAVIASMPVATVVERRNRALIAFAILTGIRDRAMVSLSLRHIDIERSPPLVRQEPDRVETKFAKAINTYFFQIGDDLKAIVADWVEELRTVHLFGPSDPLFPRTRLGHDADKAFSVDGIKPIHWSDASPVRAIFRHAFAGSGLPYFPPHSFRHTLGHLAQTVCRSPRELKAWSQNLGHENVATTLTSYGTIDPHQQGEVIGAISLQPQESENELIAKIRALVS